MSDIVSDSVRVSVRDTLGDFVTLRESVALTDLLLREKANSTGASVKQKNRTYTHSTAVGIRINII